MHGINKYMKTYTALIKARVGDQVKAVPTEIRAPSATDARWLLLAIYGFHALVSTPMEVKDKIKEVSSTPPLPPITPDQARIQSLNVAKDSATKALSSERNRQKRIKAIAATYVSQRII